MQKREMQFYDQEKVWEVYDNNDEEQNRADLTISLIPKDAQRVLDLGCGSGHITNKIDKKQVLGVDFAITPLKKVIKNAIQGSIEALPIKPGQFDLILVTEVLEHLDYEHYKKALEEIKRLECAYLLISVPYKEDLRRNVARCQECGTLFHLSHHYQSFDELSFEQMFPDYTIIKTEYCTYFYPMNSFLLEIKQKLGVYDYSDTAQCPRCDGPAVRPNTITRYVFGGINSLSRLVYRAFGIKKAYHQAVLLKRK